MPRTLSSPNKSQMEFLCAWLSCSSSSTPRARWMAKANEFVIKGGRVIDASGDRVADVVVADGHIKAIGNDLSAKTVLDATGCVVAPGLVDLHTHLREPGR